MPEQYKLDFGPEKKPEENKRIPEIQPESIHIYGFDELVADYKKKVGVDPTHRMLNRGEIISGIQDPEAEKARIALEEMEEDQKERASGRAGR